jgi:hypothetical protein
MVTLIHACEDEVPGVFPGASPIDSKLSEPG